MLRSSTSTSGLSPGARACSSNERISMLPSGLGEIALPSPIIQTQLVDNRTISPLRSKKLGNCQPSRDSDIHT